VPLGEYVAPKFGVYATRTLLHDGRKLGGVANIGVNPTTGIVEPRLEVWLFDFDEDIYGEVIETELIEFLRPEEAFRDAGGNFDVPAMVAQIHRDAARPGRSAIAGFMKLAALALVPLLMLGPRPSPLPAKVTPRFPRRPLIAPPGLPVKLVDAGDPLVARPPIAVARAHRPAFAGSPERRTLRVCQQAEPAGRGRRRLRPGHLDAEAPEGPQRPARDRDLSR
jgi:hypothetical protein